MNRSGCTLVSRRGHIYKQFPELAKDLRRCLRVRSCAIDGEIVVLAPDGRSQFYDLMFRRASPFFVAFDALAIDREDLRGRLLLETKAAA